MKVEIRSKVVILLCIVLAVFSSCITDDDDDRGDFALVAGDALPQFSVEMSDGGMLNTQSFSGKVGVIVFFSYGLSGLSERTSGYSESL